MFKKEVINADIIKKEYDVAVYMVTYNGSSTIERAIQGVLNQETNYSFYLLIYDDASTDNNAEIIKKYASKYPNKIIAVLGKENTFNWSNRKEIREWILKEYVAAKYIANCEGDDFWIDRKKLEIQLRYMYDNPDCTMTGHNGLFFNVSSSEIESIDAINGDGDVSIETIIEHRKGCCATCSFVTKKEMRFLPSYYKEVEFGDWNTMLYCATRGKVHYFDRIMSVYRIGNSDSWTSNIKKEKVKYITHCSNVIRWLALFDRETSGKYIKVINNQIDDYYDNIVRCGRDIDNLTYGNIVNKAVTDYEDGFCDIIKQEIMERHKVILNEKNILNDFRKKHNNLFIMGTGDYSKMFYKRISQDLDIDGFVVSNNQTHDVTFNGKMIYELKDVPGDKRECGILIAISKSIKREIESSLESNGFTDYLWVSP